MHIMVYMFEEKKQLRWKCFKKQEGGPTNNYFKSANRWWKKRAPFISQPYGVWKCHYSLIMPSKIVSPHSFPHHLHSLITIGHDIPPVPSPPGWLAASWRQIPCSFYDYTRSIQHGACHSLTQPLYSFIELKYLLRSYHGLDTVLGIRGTSYKRKKKTRSLSAFDAGGREWQQRSKQKRDK